jgi:AcrR family transcriptional regulator
MVPIKKKPSGEKSAESSHAPGPHNSPHNSKEQLLRAGMILFSKNGLEGTTVRDIAQLAGTNVCMVSYHFDGKEGLYRACLEEYGRARLDGNKAFVTPARSLEEFKVRLRLLVTSMATANCENREISELLSSEIEKDFPIARDIFENTFLKAYSDIVDFFKAAQTAGFIRANLDVYCIVNMIYGVVKHAVKHDGISIRYYNRSIMTPKGFEDFLDTLMSIFLEGITV